MVTDNPDRLPEFGTTKEYLKVAVEEAARVTAWKNVRRFVLLGGIGFVALDLIITLTVVILLAFSTRNTDAQVACRNTAALARIEHTVVQQQGHNTAALLKNGVTFGVSKSRLATLVTRSRAQQNQFLTSLDQLAATNCKR